MYRNISGNTTQHIGRMTTRLHSEMCTEVLTQPTSSSLRASDSAACGCAALVFRVLHRRDTRADYAQVDGHRREGDLTPMRRVSTRAPIRLHRPCRFRRYVPAERKCSLRHVSMRAPRRQRVRITLAPLRGHASPLIASREMRPRRLGRCVLCSSHAAHRLGSAPRDRRLHI